MQYGYIILIASSVIAGPDLSSNNKLEEVVERGRSRNVRPVGGFSPAKRSELIPRVLEVNEGHAAEVRVAVVPSQEGKSVVVQQVVLVHQLDALIVAVAARMGKREAKIMRVTLDVMVVIAVTMETPMLREMVMVMETLVTATA